MGEWVVRWEGTLAWPPQPSEGRQGVSSWLCIASQYKSTPGKKVSIVGWMVQLPDDPEHPDIFQLNNPDKGRRPAGARSPSRPSLLC